MFDKPFSDDDDGSLSSWWEDEFTTLASDYLNPNKPVPTTVQSRKRRYSEAADDYPNVIANLNATWRVILCRDANQWILQRRTGGRWRSVSYSRSRDGLLGRIKDKAGHEMASEAWAEINALPERPG